MNSRSQNNRPVRLTPAFRHKINGEIVLTPGIHNIYSIAEVADSDDMNKAIKEWEPGFADDTGMFWDSEKTHRKFGMDESQGLRRLGIVD